MSIIKGKLILSDEHGYKNQLIYCTGRQIGKYIYWSQTDSCVSIFSIAPGFKSNLPALSCDSSLSWEFIELCHAKRLILLSTSLRSIVLSRRIYDSNIKSVPVVQMFFKGSWKKIFSPSCLKARTSLLIRKSSLDKKSGKNQCGNLNTWVWEVFLWGAKQSCPHTCG